MANKVKFNIKGDRFSEFLEKLSDLTTIDDTIKLKIDNENILMYSMLGGNVMLAFKNYLVKKSDLGFHSNLFGGKILSWIDVAGAAYSMQVCDTPRMVTIAMDRCEFKKPAKEGQLVKIYGEIVEIGNSSIVIHIEARSHNV